MRLRVWWLAVLVLAGAACSSSNAAGSNKVPQFNPDRTKMGQIQQQGRIVIGIASDYYPFGFVGPSRAARGFTAGLGRLVANALGVRADFVARPARDLLSLVDSERADLVFPMQPITQDAVALHPFSDPYYVAHQRLLVPRGSPIRGLKDVGASRVCSAIDPGTEIPLTRLDPQAKLLEVPRAEDCAPLLKSGKAAAATGPDVALLGLRALVRGSEVVGESLTTEGYGAAVSLCDPGLAQFVTRVFAAAKRDGKWTRRYVRWVQPASGSSYLPDPPTLTVIDAWDLFPPAAGSAPPTPVACPSG